MCNECGKIKYPNVGDDNPYMQGITVCLGKGPECNKEATIIPISDWEIAERHSKGETIHPYEWD